MQALLVAAQCKRYFLMFGMAMVLGSAVLAQTEPIPSSPPAATGPIAPPPVAPDTARSAKPANSSCGHKARWTPHWRPI